MVPGQLRGGAIVVVDDVDALPSDLDRESLRRVGTRSNVTVPIFVDGQLLGALTVGLASGAPRPATPDLKDAMRLLGQVFGQALQHRHDQEQLTARPARGVRSCATCWLATTSCSTAR